jgi:TonB family protein
MAAAAAATLAGLAAGAAHAQGCRAAPWVQLPSAEDLDKVYPPKALHLGIEGTATLRCTTRLDGTLADCAVAGETPGGYEFGAAALKLAPRFRTERPCADGPDTRPGGREVPIRFAIARFLPPHREVAFQPSTGQYAGLAPAGPFWPEAALKAGAAGEVTLQCFANSNAAKLTDCEVVGENPRGLGFGQAALRMAQRGWMTAAPLGPDGPRGDNAWTVEVKFPPKTLRDRDGTPP